VKWTYVTIPNIAAPLVRRLRDHCDCFAFEQGK
jgi:hypothetical protein